MSADFWAGYVSGAASIIVGNPLDIKKVQLQAAQPPSSQPLAVGHTLSHCLRQPALGISLTSPLSSALTRYFPLKSFIAGTAGPIFGYGLLNGILFKTYHQTEDILNRAILPSVPYVSGRNAAGSNGITGSNLWTTWLAGAVGGLAIWVVSAPTELIKCKAQLASTQPTHYHAPSLSWGITCTVFRTEGVRGLYRGGAVTALRDSIGYGFYFWAYKLCGRIMTSQPALPSLNADDSRAEHLQEAAKVLLGGGTAGVVSWASVYPLDTIKTRVQQFSPGPEATALPSTVERKGAMQIARQAYREEGMRAFFRGFGPCMRRAFLVNAAQWGVYELVMFTLSQSDGNRQEEFHY